MSEKCAICGCKLSRGRNYGKPTIEGRSHATKHHYVAARFFGHTTNRKGVQRPPILKKCPWNLERQTEVFCYDCHEELLHNPVLLPEDISRFAELVKFRKLREREKTDNRKRLAGRINLLHEVLESGIKTLLEARR